MLNIAVNLAEQQLLSTLSNCHGWKLQQRTHRKRTMISVCGYLCRDVLSNTNSGTSSADAMVRKRNAAVNDAVCENHQVARAVDDEAGCLPLATSAEIDKFSTCGVRANSPNPLGLISSRGELAPADRLTCTTIAATAFFFHIFQKKYLQNSELTVSC